MSSTSLFGVLIFNLRSRPMLAVLNNNNKETVARNDQTAAHNSLNKRYSY